MIEKNRHKIAFNTRREKYEFCVIFFDLINVSIIFQNIMNDMIRSFLDKFMIVYLDDILIYNKNYEKHLEHVRLVMKTFHKDDYYAKSSKCVFFQKYIESCDHIIDDEKIRMNEKKLKCIKNWSSLQTMHDVRLFLNLCSYYRRFIENFAIICDSLYALIQKTKNKKYKFIIMIFSIKNVFECIKNIMCFDKVLTQFDIFLSFIIEIDAFDFDWDVVLYQVNLDDVKRFVAFESKRFNSIERNYVTHERKLLVIKKAFKKWRCYIENDTTTIVRIDHANLQYFKFIVNFSKKLTRWLIEFEKHDLNIKYKFDFEMIVSNTLSRRSDHRLRLLQINLRTITFDEIVVFYARDEILSKKIEWNVELKKYKNQFMLDDDDRVYHKDNSFDNWMLYTKLWARVDFLNFIHKIYDHCSFEIMFDIIKIKSDNLTWEEISSTSFVIVLNVNWRSSLKTSSEM